MVGGEVRVGLLGAGAMGSTHAYSYSLIRGARLVGVFSRDGRRAEKVAREWGARATKEVDALLNDPDIDAIDVCVPSGNHRQFVVSALKRGKHVFCETPFALSLADAKAMIDAAKRAKRILMVGLLLRSEAHYEYVRSVAASGKHGKVLSVVASRLGSYLRAGAPDHKPHYTDPSTELMTFDFDFVNSMLGRPRHVFASQLSAKAGGPLEITATFDYGRSRSATVLASGFMPTSFPFTAGFRVLFERGAYELVTEFVAGPPKISFWHFPTSGEKQAVSIQGHNPYEKELRHFVSCIRDPRIPSILGPEHALDALRLSLATQRSLRLGRSVQVVGK